MKNLLRVLLVVIGVAAVGAVFAYRLGWLGLPAFAPSATPTPSPSPSSTAAATIAATPESRPTPTPLPTRDRTVLRVALGDRASALVFQALPQYVKNAGGGVTIECITVPNASDRWQMLAAGRVDVACGTLDSFVLAARRRQPGAIIFKIASSAGFDALVARDVQNLQGLGGKRVAVVSDEGGEYLLAYFLDRTNLSSEVSIERMEDVRDALQLLQSGRVQAACLWQPYVDVARAAGMRVLASTSIDRPFLDEVCVASYPALEDREEEVREFMRGWFELEGLLSADPRLGRQTVAHDAHRKISDLDSLGLIHFYTLTDNRKIDKQSLVTEMGKIGYVWHVADVPNKSLPVDVERTIRMDLVQQIEVEPPTSIFPTRSAAPSAVPGGASSSGPPPSPEPDESPYPGSGD